VQPDFEDTVTVNPVPVADLLDDPAADLLDDPDGSDTIMASHGAQSPHRLVEPPRHATGEYGSHGAWPATEGSLPGRSRAVPADVPPAPRAAQFYGFRVGSSAIILLDAVVYIGRKPSSPRVVRGGMPRLVRVPSPTSEVSSTHLELRQLGKSVVVTDMRSTNGTTIGVPGLPVRRLRQGESLVVTPGTLIDIGDRIVIEILPLQERA
jgi:pSer/pThr/pTyr-binding forkhead associated (FHA) protein